MLVKLFERAAPLRKSAARWKMPLFGNSPEYRTTSMIYVVATIELNEGMRDQFLAEQKHLLPLVRAEAGCIEYTPSVDRPVDPAKTPPRADTITMQEKWQTLDHLKAHSVAPHMSDFRPKTKHMITSVKVEVFESV